MRLCWLLLVVLGCRSSQAAPSLSSGVADDCGHSVLIPCPNVTGNTLRFNLFKDQQVVCNCTCELEQDAWRCEPRCSRSDVKPHQSEDGKLSHFMVTASKSPAAFRCEATVTFPPPLRSIQTETVVLVLVEGRQCEGGQNGPLGDEDDTARSQRLLWIWIMVVSLLSIYSLAVTVLAWVGWAKLRRTELQNDYMNTKPRIQRAPRKKKGIQNPLPRHF